jgi:ABC-2 type transport system ATP-binding protein
VIEVKGLTRYYGNLAAVRDVSFSIPEHAIVGFLGLNGAGKSTVLKMLAGLVQPSEGSVWLGGADIAEAPESFRKNIGYLPEDPPLYKDMTVEAFLSWCGEVRGMNRAEVQARIPEVVKICQLASVRNRVIQELSHGFKKRVGIAQAIIHKPTLVILDEPISGLDPVQIVEMREVLKALAKQCTVLVSSHILSEISQTCDTILVLHEGRIVAEGSEAELRGQLKAHSTVELVVRGQEEEIRRVLATLEGVEILSFEPSGETVRLVVGSTAGEDHREAVIRALVQADCGIRGVREAASSELESVFLSLTREVA